MVEQQKLPLFTLTTKVKLVEGEIIVADKIDLSLPEIIRSASNTYELLCQSIPKNLSLTGPQDIFRARLNTVSMRKRREIALAESEPQEDWVKLFNVQSHSIEYNGRVLVFLQKFFQQSTSNVNNLYKHFKGLNHFMRKLASQITVEAKGVLSNRHYISIAWCLSSLNSLLDLYETESQIVNHLIWSIENGKVPVTYFRKSIFQQFFLNSKYANNLMPLHQAIPHITCKGAHQNSFYLFQCTYPLVDRDIGQVSLVELKPLPIVFKGLPVRLSFSTYVFLYRHDLKLVSNIQREKCVRSVCDSELSWTAPSLCITHILQDPNTIHETKYLNCTFQPIATKPFYEKILDRNLLFTIEKTRLNVSCQDQNYTFLINEPSWLTTNDTTCIATFANQTFKIEKPVHHVSIDMSKINPFNFSRLISLLPGIENITVFKPKQETDWQPLAEPMLIDQLIKQFYDLQKQRDEVADNWFDVVNPFSLSTWYKIIFVVILLFSLVVVFCIVRYLIGRCIPRRPKYNQPKPLLAMELKETKHFRPSAPHEECTEDPASILNISPF